MCEYLHACLFMNCVHAILMATRRRHQISWNWSYRQLWAAMWVLGTEAGFSTRAVSALNPGVIVSAPLNPKVNSEDQKYLSSILYTGFGLFPFKLGPFASYCQAFCFSLACWRKPTLPNVLLLVTLISLVYSLIIFGYCVLGALSWTSSSVHYFW